MKKLKRRLKIASVLIMTTVFMTPVNAQTKPIEVEIPVHVDANEHVITITSPDAPLPVNRTQTLKNETKSFTVTLYEPKKYHYTLIDRNGQRFTTVIFVWVDSENRLQATISATQDGEHKADITFEEPKKNQSTPPYKQPKTGDQTNINIYGYLLIISFVVIGMIVHTRKKNK